MTTPTAPAFCALITLLLYRQVPRWTNAIAPLSEPDGRAEHASPSFCNWATSRSGKGGGATCGPLPNKARMFCRLDGTPPPLTCTAWYNTWEFMDAPTVMAEGAVPGVWIEFRVG